MREQYKGSLRAIVGIAEEFLWNLRLGNLSPSVRAACIDQTPRVLSYTAPAMREPGFGRKTQYYRWARYFLVVVMVISPTEIVTASRWSEGPLPCVTVPGSCSAEFLIAGQILTVCGSKQSLWLNDLTLVVKQQLLDLGSDKLKYVNGVIKDKQPLHTTLNRKDSF